MTDQCRAPMQTSTTAFYGLDTSAAATLTVASIEVGPGAFAQDLAFEKTGTLDARRTLVMG